MAASEGKTAYHRKIGKKDDDNKDSDSSETHRLAQKTADKTVQRSNGLQAWAVLLLVLSAVVVVFLTAGISSGGKRDKNSTRTSCGIVEGVWHEHDGDEGIFVFKGIPYAAPPVGSRRWQSPVRLEDVDGCWGSTPFKAVDYGQKCAQLNLFENKVEGSEDCLFLNVWTPTLDPDADLPVMFYIHGGSLIAGSGGESLDTPSAELVRNSQMVYVTINYRLNAFGFLALKVLSEASSRKVSGNYGFMDQIAALKWVRENIKQFGGDPKKVTIYGESSGGTSVLVLLASPLADGLFKNAWALSSSANFINSSLELAEENNEVFITKTKCLQDPLLLDCLKSLTTEEVLNAIPWSEHPRWFPSIDEIFNLPLKGENYGNLAIVDGYVLEKEPVEVWNSGKRKDDISVLLATTAQEADLLLSPAEARSWNQSEYEAYVHSRLDSFGGNISAEAIAMYRSNSDGTHETPPPDDQFTTMITDIRATCPTNEIGKALTNLTAAVSRYIAVNRPSQGAEFLPGSGFPPALYAFHAWDVVAFTGNVGVLLKTPGKSDNEFTLALRHVASDLVHGNIKSDRWFPHKVMVIDTDVKTEDSYHSEMCDFWNEHGFYTKYAWKN